MNRNGRGGKVAPNGYKILSIVLAALLAAVAVVELVLWRLDYIVFQNPNAQEQTVGTQDSLIIGESEGNGVEIKSAKIPAEQYAEYGVSALAETAYTLTATITPADATNKAVDWTVAFANPSSAWANGKTVTDYVTVTPESDGALTANVECLQDFGEQIIVTVTSRENDDISANCTVDYRKKVEDIAFYFGNSNGSRDVPFTTDSESVTIDSDQTFLLVEPEYSAYTIDDTFDFTFGMKIEDDAFWSLKYEYDAWLDSSEQNVSFTSTSDKYHLNFYGLSMYDDDVKAAMRQYLADHDGEALFEFSFSATGTYSSFPSGTVLINFNMVEPVTGIELDKTNVVF